MGLDLRAGDDRNRRGRAALPRTLHDRDVPRRLGERPEPVIIPTEVIPLVRECVREGIPMVCEDIERAGVILGVCPKANRPQRPTGPDRLGRGRRTDRSGGRQRTRPHAGGNLPVPARNAEPKPPRIRRRQSREGQGREGTWLPHGDPQAGAGCWEAIRLHPRSRAIRSSAIRWRGRPPAPRTPRTVRR